MSRLRAPLAVAAARLRASPGRALLVVLGVAASQAMLVAVLGGSVVARDRAVQRAVAELPASARSFRVDAFGLPPGTTYPAADASVRAALAPLSHAEPLRATFFRQLTIDRELVQIAAVDRLDRLARLRAGRLPRSCRPERCEVLQLGAGGRAGLDEGGIHLRRVGTAELPDRALLGAALEPGSTRARPVVLLAEDARALDRLPAFGAFFRTYSWIDPIEPRRLHVWEIGGVLEHETRAQATLARLGDAFALSGPDQALLDARSRGRVSAKRLVLVGGEVSALLLGFALVAAMGLRRGLADERRRLLQRGATRPQARLAGTAEVTAVTLAGSVLGIGAGVLAIALVAGAAGSPWTAVLDHALPTATGIGLVAGAWVASTAALVAVASLREPDPRRRRIRPLDVAALGALAAVAVGLSRGGLSADSLSSGGDATLLLLLPGLICFAAAVAAARLLHPLMRAAERAARGAPSALRLALLALARAPARTAATAAFLVVSLALAFFAASYRATLSTGAREEAAFAVPLDFALSEGARLVLPLDAAPLERYRRLAPGTQAYPVVRRSASVAALGTSVQSPSVLGLPAAALSGLRWRSDFSRDPPAELARRLGADGPAALRGTPLPPGARSASLDVRVHGVGVRLELVVERRGGALDVLPLGERGPGSWPLTARLPRGARQLVALQVTEGTSGRLSYTHRAAEGTVAAPDSGSLVASPLSVGSPAAARTIAWRGWLARGAERLPGAGDLRLAYSFGASDRVVVRRPQATDGRPLRVVVSRSVARAAGAGGRLTLDFQVARIPARVVAVASRFPGAEQSDEGFVVADESRLRTALDADAPGAGRPDELWLAVAPHSAAAVERALRAPPFSSLVVASRRALERSLAEEPLARGITITLGAAALLTLLLAAVGFWVALASELRDERGELFDLEAQGVGLETIRSQFRLRAAALVALGAVGGFGLGLVLSRLVVAIVRVSASTALARPPLRLDPSWPAALTGLAALVVAVAALVEVTTRVAVRGEVPR
jgi:hypothetical protein